MTTYRLARSWAQELGRERRQWDTMPLTALDRSSPKKKEIMNQGLTTSGRDITHRRKDGSQASMLAGSISAILRTHRSGIGMPTRSTILSSTLTPMDWRS